MDTVFSMVEKWPLSKVLVSYRLWKLNHMSFQLIFDAYGKNFPDLWYKSYAFFQIRPALFSAAEVSQLLVVRKIRDRETHSFILFYGKIINLLESQTTT